MPPQSDTYFKARLSSLPVDLPLAYDVYIIVNDAFVLFRKQRDVITTQRMAGLLEHNLKEVFIPKEGFFPILIEFLLSMNYWINIELVIKILKCFLYFIFIVYENFIYISNLI